MAPMQNFEQIRTHLAGGDYRIKMQEPYVMCVELSLEKGTRHQAIFLSEMQDEEGREYLRVSTAVAWRRMPQRPPAIAQPRPARWRSSPRRATSPSRRRMASSGCGTVRSTPWSTTTATSSAR